MKTPLALISCGLAAVTLLTAPNLAAEAGRQLPTAVKVARSPDRPWTEMATRTLADLPTIPADPETSTYGGFPKPIEEATGFFRVTQSAGRWWLVDPEGHPFIHRGVSSVRQIRTAGASQSLSEKFGSHDGWAEATSVLLHENGFNGIGAWSDEETLDPASSGLVYTKLWNFMAAYGKQRGGTYQKPGHTGYPNNCPFIFDPEFPVFCDQHARKLRATKDDPWLLGHFTDNELPWSEKMLGNYLELPESDPGHQAALHWLRQRHGSAAMVAHITPADRRDFVAYAADTYFAAVTAAIRKHDPNHLVLGSRFHGRAVRLPQLFEAAGRHLDVVSVNYYHAWTPDPELVNSWATNSEKPILITEWYAKAVDSKLANTSGAGWLVQTQADRAAFYQNFTLALLESQVCVGWHWFRYSDNDPEEKSADPSNLDANKGTVSNRYQPYETLLSAMKEVNFRTYNLIRHFDDAKEGPPAD